MLEKLISLIYPNVCGICNKIDSNSLCKKCEIRLEKYKSENIIDYTKDKKEHFDYHVNVFKYEGIIREKLIDYKFNEKAYLYKTFSKIILNDKKICVFFEKYDIIIPVPIHKKRKLKRGYNQTELVGQEIAKKIGLEFEKGTLIKIKNTKAQSRLKQDTEEKKI